VPVFTLAHFGHHVVGALLRPMLPMIQREFGLDYAGVGWVQMAYATTGGFSQVPAGWLADRLGPRLVVTVGVAGVAAAGVLIGLSPNFGALIAFLIVAAVMEGGYHPASAAAISMTTPSGRRGRALGTHLIGGSSAFWVVPLLAAQVAGVDAFGWRGAYVSLSTLAMVLGIVLYILLRGRGDGGSIEQRIARAEGQAPPGPVRWGQLLPFIVMSVATGAATQSVSGFLSVYAVDHFQVSDATAARLMAISPAVGLVVAPLGGYLSDRLGPVRVAIAVCFLAAPAIYLLGVAPNVALLVGVMVLLGIISFVRMSTSEAYIVGQVPEGRRATVLGIYYFASREGGGLLAPAVGRLIDSLRFLRTVTYVGVVLAAINAVSALLLWRNRNLGNA
jgi:MFS family permease